MDDKLTNESRTSDLFVDLGEGASGSLPGVRNRVSSGAKTVTVPTPRLPARSASNVVKICENPACAAEYVPRSDKVRTSRFCSARCRSVIGAKTLAADQAGEKNPNWKGGISKDATHYAQRDRERHPEQWKARSIVRSAIVAGKLLRQPCEKCGTTEDVQAHHDDYSKPLSVRWLCRPHHRAHHEAERREKAA